LIFPLKMVIFRSYVSLPEGMSCSKAPTTTKHALESHPQFLPGFDEGYIIGLLPWGSSFYASNWALTRLGMLGMVRLKVPRVCHAVGSRNQAFL
jgi:hypothetical protein